MKKVILGLVCAIVVIAGGYFIYNKFFAVKATIPIYSCTFTGYDGKEYTSTTYDKIEDGTCKVVKEYNCKYDKCKYIASDSNNYAVIYDSNGSKGEYVIIDENAKKILGPVDEIKYVKPYYFLTKSNGSSTYTVYESNYKKGLELVIENKFNDVYSINTGDQLSYSYIGVVNGKHGIIDQDNINNSKYSYDLMSATNYHGLGFNSLKAYNGEKVNILYSGVDGYTEAFNEWFDAIETFNINDIVYIAYAKENKIYIGTFDYKKFEQGVSAVEREFKLTATLNINYTETINFHIYDTTKIGITIDGNGYLYDVTTNQLTEAVQ